MNGSVTPKVIGSGRFDGSGSLTISRIRWFCQKHSDVATTSADSAMMILRPQLVEVVDERQPVLVVDRPYARHGSAASSVLSCEP